MIEMILEHLIVLIVAAVTPFVMLLVHKLLTALTTKFHINNAQNYELQLDTLVQTAIQGLEQKAVSTLKTTTVVAKGEDKLNSAIQWVNTELTSMNLPEVDVAQLAVRIEAALFQGASAPPAPAVVPTPVAPIVAPAPTAPVVAPAPARKGK